MSFLRSLFCATIISFPGLIGAQEKNILSIPWNQVARKQYPANDLSYFRAMLAPFGVSDISNDSFKIQVKDLSLHEAQVLKALFFGQQKADDSTIVVHKELADFYRNRGLLAVFRDIITCRENNVDDQRRLQSLQNILLRFADGNGSDFCFQFVNDRGIGDQKNAIERFEQYIHLMDKIEMQRYISTNPSLLKQLFSPLNEPIFVDDYQKERLKRRFAQKKFAK